LISASSVFGQALPPPSMDVPPPRASHPVLRYDDPVRKMRALIGRELIRQGFVIIPGCVNDVNHPAFNRQIGAIGGMPVFIQYRYTIIRIQSGNCNVTSQERVLIGKRNPNPYVSRNLEWIIHPQLDAQARDQHMADQALHVALENARR
jgi:hypothetical protein